MRSHSDTLQRSIAEELSQYGKRLRVIEDLHKKFEELQMTAKKETKDSATLGKDASTGAQVKPASGGALSSATMLVLVIILTILLLKSFLPAESE